MSSSPQPTVAKAPSLLRSGAVVGVMTMLSRVLGLVRDVVFARFLGADAGADAFFVAFKVPNFLRRLFAEGAFAQAFVPVLSELRQNNAGSALKLFIDHVAGCLGVSLLAITTLCVVAAPLLAVVFAPGFYFDNPEKMALTGDLIRITFPYLLCISLAGFLGAILNSFDRFAVPAVTPVLLNIVLIIAAVFVAPRMGEPAMALAYGVLVAGVLQFSFQLPFVAQLGLLPKPKPVWSDPNVKKVLLLMAPAIFGVSVSQINLLLDTVLASFLPSGSVSWLFYSDRLTELPLGVFGVGIATVILPALSRQHTASSEHYSSTLNWAIRCVLVIALPATVALVVLAKPILFTLFQYGEMGVRDVNMASVSLMAYSLGLPAFMLIKVLASGYFARQDTKTPVRIGIIAMVANMGLNVLFVVPLHFGWQLGHAGLALATCASAFLNAGLLYRGLLKSQAFVPENNLLRFALLLCVASLVMGAGLWFSLQYLPSFEVLGWLPRIGYTALFCMAGFAVYVLVLLLLGVRVRDFKPNKT
ncbi:murein biosynthesis integral membrane protein MurJ [Marinagarivorans cellulosilyticus]|uniref:Probable lipid II flippase MurJ n=1 Tax=Marinagarivorans cellulosilyticus TaxID=2721545 RepID=A0AAN1WG27_9GAMM|nr:murein biosynthesis integral membrane protein MurJ [Marinagarivorans cellulosilyticus]BCD96944.1 putative peptidoglycan lipid II flippase [Marinagarivorans cellulosilyticus]